MACPICRGKDKIFSLKVKDYEYNLKAQALYMQCKACRSIYRKHPKKVKNKIYTKTKYLPLKGNIIYDLLKNVYAEHEKRIIYELLSDNFFKKQRIILDIACGKGFLIKKFSSNKNFHCYGTDINISTTKKWNVNFIRSSFNNMKIVRKINPDLIIVNNFIEHMENPDKVIEKASKILSSNGYICITTGDIG